MTSAGKTALIVGAGKNLGALTARQLAEEGVNVAVHYNAPGSKAGAEETVKAVEAKGAKAAAFQADLTKPAEVEKLFAAAKEHFGGIDIAINNCGMVLKKPILDTTEDEFDKMILINSKAAYFFIKEAGKTLNKGGKILTLVTSLLGAFTPMYSTYAGSKAPVEHFTRAAAKEFGPSKGISVNCVAPGPMDTPFFYPQETDDAIAFLKSQSMTGELTNIKDIAPLIVFLVTKGGWINGQTIFPNGGALATR